MMHLPNRIDRLRICYEGDGWMQRTRLLCCNQDETYDEMIGKAVSAELCRSRYNDSPAPKRRSSIRT